MLIEDHFYTGGVGHTNCQDYSISGKFMPESYEKYFHYGIVCDGCSQVPDSDIGARLLALCAKQAIHYILGPIEILPKGIDPKDFFTRVGVFAIEKAYSVSKDLGIPAQTLTATLLISIREEGTSKTHVCVFGDGFVFGVKDRQLSMNKIKDEREAPYYLFYSLFPEMQKLYRKNFGNNSTIENSSFSLDDKIIPQPDVRSQDVGEMKIFSFDDYDYVGICSDGFDQMSEIDEMCVKFSLTYQEVMCQVLDIKNFNGEFVSRHLGFLTKRKWRNKRELFDDISISIIAKVED